MGWPGLPNRFDLLKARIWLVVIAVASIAVLLGLHTTMSTLELGWCDDRHDLPLACRVVREPVDWFQTRVLGMPVAASCRTPVAALRSRGARVWITDGALLPDGGALIDTRFAMKRGTTPQKLVRLLPDGRVDEGFELGQDCAPQHKLFRGLPDGSTVLIGGAPDGDDDLTRVTVIGADGANRMFRARGACGVAAGNIRDMVPDRRGWLLLAGQFDIGGEIALLARLERDGRCTVPFQPPSPPGVTDGIAGTTGDGGVLLRLRQPDTAPLLRYQADGGLDLAYVAAVQQLLLERGWPWPVDAEMLVDGSTLLSFAAEVSTPSLALLDPGGGLRQAVTLGEEGAERRVANAWPLAEGGALFTVDGRSRDTAQTLRVPAARLWKLLPDGTLDQAFNDAARELAPGAGNIVVLDAAPDGRLLVAAHWYGAPPQPFTWPWPVETRVFQIDRTGRRLDRFAPPEF